MLAAAQVAYAMRDALQGVGITPADERVYVSRSWPLTEAQLPAWRVVRQQEEVRAETVHYPVAERHVLIVDLQGSCRDVADVDDALDEMASAALAALFGTQEAATLGGLNVTLELVRIDRDLAQEGEAATGRVTVSVQAQYYTRSNDPETIL